MLVTNPSPKTVKRNKLILFWNRFLQMKAFNVGLGERPFRPCKVWANCETTEDRGRLWEADAVLVHVPTLNGSHTGDLPPAARRSPRQRWVFFSAESPVWRHNINFTLYDSLFNWTMTYRLDSDVVRYYGNVQPRRTYRGASYDYAGNKRNSSVLWFNSHCRTSSKREKLFSQLSKYYPVAEYGKCSEKVCNRSCGDEKIAEHKFYFSAENAICRDYVTEKFVQLASQNIVPVVLGGGDYTHFVPKSGYVDVRDFGTVRDLAKHLHYLDKNDTAYNEMFAWKSSYKVRHNNAFCQLCRKLNEDSGYRTYEDMDRWWREDKCKTKNVWR